MEDHTYEGVIRDIKMYLPKIKVGGFIAGHDLGRESVTKALRNQLGEVDARFEDSSLGCSSNTTCKKQL